MVSLFCANHPSWVVDAQGAGQIYNIALLGYNNKREIHFYWYGSPVAYGYLEAEFKADLGVNDWYKLAIHWIEAAIRRNAGTGDGIDVVITDRNGSRKLSKLKRLSGRLFRTYLPSRRLSIVHL
jgi:proteasome beta subunit